MSCIAATLRRVRYGLAVSMTRIGEDEGGEAPVPVPSTGVADAVMRRVGGMTVRMGLVCATDIGECVLWASDAALLTADGEFIYVTEE